MSDPSARVAPAALGDGPLMSRRRMRTLYAGVAVLVLIGAVWLVAPGRRDVSVIVGKSDAMLMPEATTVPVPVYVPHAPARVAAKTLGPPAAVPPAPPYRTDLHFFLVVGSDARPGEDIARSRADSIHVVAVDPVAQRGTVLGLPRDSYVNIPGHGKRKLNAALVLGGPQLLVRTVQDVTGLPISYYALTGFQGIVEMVDELDGVDVYVPYRMDDDLSGARFSEGWHHMNGEDVLAFTRARHGVPGGDFGRSQNQGRVIVHALQKARAEVRDEGGIKRWLDILFRRAHLDMPFTEALRLGAVARQIMPASLSNIVAPGHGRTIRGESVVILDEAAFALFRDIRVDAVVDGWTVEPVAEPAPKPAPPPPAPEPTPTPGLLPPLPVPVPGP